jgi:hypothetical protein
MKLEQVEIIVSILKDCFQNAKGYESATIAPSWHSMGLDDIPFDVALMLIKTAVKDGVWTYPPSLNDILKAYNDSLPKTTPTTFESLSERSWLRLSIVRIVRKRYPGYKKTHQFSSEEEMHKSLHIVEQQRRKFEAELFEKFLPEVQRLTKQGLPLYKVIEIAFGPEYIPPHLRNEANNLLSDLAKQTAKRLPGAKDE